MIAYHHLPDGNEIRIQDFSIENVVASIQEFEYDLKLAIDTGLGHAQELGSREAVGLDRGAVPREAVRVDTTAGEADRRTGTPRLGGDLSRG